MTGIDLIAAERKRQQIAEHWSSTHDDMHINRELTKAAICYAAVGVIDIDSRHWPWTPGWWKPRDRVRNLVKAGALIAAEIDRLQRLEGINES